jgi:dienelactone hydrolase
MPTGVARTKAAHRTVLVRRSALPCLIIALIASGGVVRGFQTRYRTLNDRFAAPKFSNLDQWKVRAEYLREHILATAGLLPFPERNPLRPAIFDEVKRADYRLSKVYFESLPGFFVTGNLYRPIGEGPFPAMLSPHGHWPYGRLENTPVASGPLRAINLARQGFVVFTYDMIGYNDSRQLPHTFGGRREALWGLSLAGLQLWNSIRSLDFLESLPYVRRDALGVTGESGGGTQTFLLSAVDNRVAVAAPVNMISLHMQGGCLCENQPALRLDTTNVEIAATIAPRPLLMVSATGDWTSETIELEYPAVRAIYELHGAAGHVNAVRFTAEHNYNRDSREAMYAWMARWLLRAPADVRPTERSSTPEPLQNLLVFHQRPLPAEAVDAAGLTRNWIASAERQLEGMPPNVSASLFRHVLGFAGEPATSDAAAPQSARVVLLASEDRELEKRVTASGFRVRPIQFTPFDAEAAAKISHFETYNRTPASQRVADIVAAIRANPGAALVADGDAGLAGLLASAIAPPRLAILGVGPFDTSSDQDFIDRLYIPGLRRAGDLNTAARLAKGKIIVHDATDRLAVEGLEAQPRKLTAAEIVKALRSKT